MATERLHFLARQQVLIRASKLYEDGAKLLREGNEGHAQEILGRATRELGKVAIVDKAYAAALEILKDGEVADLPSEYIQELQTPEPLYQPLTQPVEEALQEVTEKPVPARVRLESRLEGKTLVDIVEQRLGSASADKPVSKSELLELLTPRLPDGKARGQALSYILSKLRKRGLKVVNVTPASQRAEGIEARYYSEGEERADTEPPAATLQLSRGEVFVLAQVLTDKTHEELEALGVSPGTGDQAVMGELVQESTGSFPENGEAYAEAWDGLKEKLLAFIQDKEGVYTASAEDEDALILLGLLYQLNSEEQVDRLLASKPVNTTPRFGKLTSDEIAAFRTRKR